MSAVVYRLSRLRCRLLGHAWSAPDPVYGNQYCTRTACRGHLDAWRWGGAA